VHVVDFDRYRLRLHLECPLLGVPGHRRHRAFDQYTAELVRDDDTVCAAARMFFVRIDDARVDHARAAAEIGSEFLAKVCSEALDWRGAVLEDIEAEFMQPAGSPSAPGRRQATPAELTIYGASGPALP